MYTRRSRVLGRLDNLVTVRPELADRLGAFVLFVSITVIRTYQVLADAMMCCGVSDRPLVVGVSREI